MEILINKIDVRDVNGNGSDVLGTYLVSDNNNEFTITCRSNHYGRTLSLVGKEGTLYIDREDGKVHLQKVALGGGCGLLIDDEPVDGLSPMAIHGIIVAEQDKEAREIIITIEQSANGADQLSMRVDGIVTDPGQYSEHSET